MIRLLLFSICILSLLVSAVAQVRSDACSKFGTDAATGATDSAQADSKKTMPDKTKDKVLLSRVVCEVEQALDAYQQSMDVEDKKILPKLASVDFDFKTTVDTKGGLTVSFFIFKLGANAAKQSVNDLDFQYVPKSLLRTGLEVARASTLQQQLLETIRAAAQAVKDQRALMLTSPDRLTFKQLTVALGYGVTWTGTGTAAGPIQLVTVSGSLDRSKNTVQQVKLIFAPPKTEGDTKPE
jgi:hypothetical protein